MSVLNISPIRAFSDNYIWLISRENQAYVVDPGEPAPVLSALDEAGLQLLASSSRTIIMTTRVQ